MWGKLILAMLRVSILGFGGGPSSIPLMHKEVVEKYNWLDSDQFSDILAVGNALPGPILTKMAGYIGFRLKGVLGAVIAVLITTVPTIVGMVLLFTFLGSFQEMPRVQGATTAIQPVVGVMLAVMAYTMLTKSKKKLGLSITLAMVIISIVLLSWFHIHPAILIIALLIVGVSVAKPIDMIKRKEVEKQ